MVVLGVGYGGTERYDGTEGRVWWYEVDGEIDFGESDEEKEEERGREKGKEELGGRLSKFGNVQLSSDFSAKFGNVQLSDDITASLGKGGKAEKRELDKREFVDEDDEEWLDGDE
eukprot:2179969-Rhodomonas_salina.1